MSSTWAPRGKAQLPDTLFSHTLCDCSRWCFYQPVTLIVSLWRRLLSQIRCLFEQITVSLVLYPCYFEVLASENILHHIFFSILIFPNEHYQKFRQMFLICVGLTTSGAIEIYKGNKMNTCYHSTLFAVVLKCLHIFCPSPLWELESYPSPLARGSIIFLLSFLSTF